MKKFLWLAITLTFLSGDANALLPCALRSAENCETPEGFLEEQHHLCAGPETNCRRTFCQSVCTNCDAMNSNRDLKKLCADNCTRITFTNGLELHNALQQCFGNIASASASIGLSAPENALANTIPDLVKHFKAATIKQEQLLLEFNQAHQTVDGIEEQIMATNDDAAEDLVKILKNEARQKVGTYDVAEDRRTSYRSLSSRRSSPSRRSLPSRRPLSSRSFSARSLS